MPFCWHGIDIPIPKWKYTVSTQLTQQFSTCETQDANHHQRSNKRNGNQRFAGCSHHSQYSVENLGSVRIGVTHMLHRLLLLWIFSSTSTSHFHYFMYVLLTYISSTIIARQNKTYFNSIQFSSFSFRCAVSSAR